MMLEYGERSWKIKKLLLLDEEDECLGTWNVKLLGPIDHSLVHVEESIPLGSGSKLLPQKSCVQC